MTLSDDLLRASERLVEPEEAPRLAESALRRLEALRASSGKVCASCGEAKPLSAFHADRRKRDGLRSSCKACRSAV